MPDNASTVPAFERAVGDHEYDILVLVPESLNDARYGFDVSTKCGQQNDKLVTFGVTVGLRLHNVPDDIVSTIYQGATVSNCVPSESLLYQADALIQLPLDEVVDVGRTNHVYPYPT